MENVMTWLNNWLDELEEHKAYLSDLDQKIGDGDHGNNMARGGKAVKEKLDADTPEAASDIFMVFAQNLMSKIGGASGPLYGSAFLAMATTAKQTDDLGDIFAAGLDKIKQRGKAEAGEKTMVDMWEPAIEAIKAENWDTKVLDDARENVINLKATKGRASYYGDRTVGEMDPGAESSYYLFKELFEAHA